MTGKKCENCRTEVGFDYEQRSHPEIRTIFNTRELFFCSRKCVNSYAVDNAFIKTAENEFIKASASKRDERLKCDLCHKIENKEECHFIKARFDDKSFHFCSLTHADEFALKQGFKGDAQNNYVRNSIRFVPTQELNPETILGMNIQGVDVHKLQVKNEEIKPLFDIQKSIELAEKRDQKAKKFFYLLMRDVANVGQIESILAQVEKTDDVPVFTSEHLANLAQEMSLRLIKKD